MEHKICREQPLTRCRPEIPNIERTELSSTRRGAYRDDEDVRRRSTGRNARILGGELDIVGSRIVKVLGGTTAPCGGPGAATWIYVHIEVGIEGGGNRAEPSDSASGTSCPSPGASLEHTSMNERGNLCRRRSLKSDRSRSQRP
ncbi:hypothetical protein HYPSUDRAFT_673426 [Hypholoma sublateritium FD-334 SS-4]|uniref:Uncharacterized protein n=1 Tax=Hypholoma sublateritium (strain FD-334 SS-4) TaxID=945553 RepID=A0A0D2NW95_HYPSF|nr:hypothetical protein HYPSUDRAFT_673426 [Hypholoma sublateritium FD-334 SS-4]